MTMPPTSLAALSSGSQWEEDCWPSSRSTDIWEAHTQLFAAEGAASLLALHTPAEKLSQDCLQTHWLAALSTQQFFNCFQKKKKLPEDSG